MSDINDATVLVRALDVTARLTRSVKDLGPMGTDGILLETLIGRYVLDRDASAAWLLIDGSRNVGQVSAAVARSRGVDTVVVLPAVRDLCGDLERLGLLEVLDVLVVP